MLSGGAGSPRSIPRDFGFFHPIGENRADMTGGAGSLLGFCLGCQLAFLVWIWAGESGAGGLWGGVYCARGQFRGRWGRGGVGALGRAVEDVVSFGF